jgi:hypothetical protein
LAAVVHEEEVPRTTWLMMSLSLYLVIYSWLKPSLAWEYDLLTLTTTSSTLSVLPGRQSVTVETKSLNH